MNPFLNLIWLLCGGIFTAIEYLIASLLMMVTIIGIPFGFQTLKLAGLALWPFGKEVRSTPDSGGCLSIIMNIVWLFLGGIWISHTHQRWGILLSNKLESIPFGRQHFKLAGLALTPFGKVIVDKGFLSFYLLHIPFRYSYTFRFCILSL